MPTAGDTSSTRTAAQAAQVIGCELSRIEPRTGFTTATRELPADAGATGADVRDPAA